VIIEEVIACFIDYGCNCW